MLTASLALAVALSSAGYAQKPVCDLFADREVAHALDVREVKKQAVGGAAACTWSSPGIMLTVARHQASSPQELEAMMAGMQRTLPVPGESSQPESGLGDRAVSIRRSLGRSLTLLVTSGTVLWRFEVEKVDRQIDAAAVKPKLTALAKAAVDGLLSVPIHNQRLEPARRESLAGMATQHHLLGASLAGESRGSAEPRP